MTIAIAFVGPDAFVPLAVAALGLASLHMVSSARRRLRRVSALPDAIRSTLRSEGREEAAVELLDGVRRLVRADAAWVALLPRTGSLPIVALRSAGSSSQPRPASLSPAQRALVESASKSQHPIGSGRRREAVTAVVASLGARHGMAVAIRGEERVLAVLLVARSRRRFGADDRHVLGLVAEHAGIVLENDQLERSIRELTDLKEELRHRADFDTLTRLPNRTVFTTQVARALEDGSSRIAVLFLDLDDFKVVNDSLGHQAGDELLAAVGGRLAAAIRPTDLAARLGGDEFAVLVRCVGDDDGERVADRLVEALEDPFTVAGREVSVHTSVGIAYGRAGRTAAGDLLRFADLAMYEAKQCGKRRHACYEPSMDARVRARHDLVNALERGIERGEIELHYQPIVDLASGRLVAVEALSRWQRPGLGLIEPAGFIDVADEAGLMLAMGRAVLREAVRQGRSWRRAYPERSDLRITVNLAPTELQDPTLAAFVAEVLEDAGLEPDGLVLEITESGVMRSPEAALATMRELRALGVSLALDDFGTGHSSLAYLRAFPLDMLKIARQFVGGIAGGAQDVVFVDAIVRLATALELDVVAEGIEAVEQVRALGELGCGLGQGYHFGRPVAPLGLSDYLNAERLPPPRTTLVAA